MKHPDLEIIIVNYNASFWLKKTLSTLQSFYLDHTNRKVLVTVVDNGSTDDSVAMISANYPKVQKLLLPENKGFGYANNQAMEKSQATYILLLNSDVELNANSNLDLLLDFMDEKQQIGIMTPKVQFTNGKLDPACHRGEPTLWASFTYFAHLEELFPKTTTFGQYHQGYKNSDSIHSIDACSGAAMIIRNSVLRTVGLFDERFFMYAEDLDLCRRVRDAGYLVVFHPGAVVIHHKYKSGIRGTTKQISKLTRRHFYDTMLQYYDKYYRTKYPEFVRSVVKMVIAIKKGAQ